MFNFCLLLLAETGMRVGVSFVYLHYLNICPKIQSMPKSLGLLQVKYLPLVVVSAGYHLFLLVLFFFLQIKDKHFRVSFVFMALVPVFMTMLFVKIRLYSDTEFSGKRKQQCRT